MKCQKVLKMPVKTQVDSQIQQSKTKHYKFTISQGREKHQMA